MPIRAPRLLVIGLSLLVAGCGGLGGSTGAPSGKLQVVAAENFWGSIASQLAGSRLAVRSVIVNANTDPHAYEPTASDGIALASANMVIVNGIGYDRWASNLTAANPDSARILLSVGALLGLKEGTNPHQWYSPASVQRVIGQIVADYKRLDAKDAAYFDRRQRIFSSTDLARYDQLRREIRSRYAGVPVGYSESVFQPLGQDLALKLLTPYNFAKAVAEGTDVSAADKQTVDAQAQRHAIRVWVFNSQNVTPDVQRVSQIARGAHIPIATVTETLAPATDSFEQWQARQLAGLFDALHRATGR